MNERYEMTNRSIVQNIEERDLNLSTFRDRSPIKNLEMKEIENEIKRSRDLETASSQFYRKNSKENLELRF